MTIKNIPISNNNNNNLSLPPIIVTFSDFVIEYSPYAAPAKLTSSSMMMKDNLGDEIVARCIQRNIPFLPKQEIEELKLLYTVLWEKLEEVTPGEEKQVYYRIREAARNDVSTIDYILTRLVEVTGKKYYSWKALIPTKLTDEDRKKNKVCRYRHIDDIRYVPGGEYFYDHGYFGGSNYYKKSLTLEKVRVKICKMLLGNDIEL